MATDRGPNPSARAAGNDAICISRRGVLTALGLATVTAVGCTPRRRGGADGSRLSARPPARRELKSAPESGLSTLDVRNARREVLLYVPRTAEDAAPPRLVLSFHGAGGEPTTAVGRFRRFADENRLMILAPASQSATWDVVSGGWGRDVKVIDAALEQVFSAYDVDDDMIISGFSDGASYALSLGLANGDLFRHIIAFSPGFVATAPHVGSPDIFISHGTKDQVLPIDSTTRVIAPDLLEQGYAVKVYEFNGPHGVTDSVMTSAIRWLNAVS